jgi:hypothetical protein
VGNGLLLLMAVPAAFVLIAAVLLLSWLAERWVLSPRSMILSAARATRSRPELTEQLVAREAERLLGGPSVAKG